MTNVELLADLTRMGLVLTAKGDRLAYDAPPGVLTPVVLAKLKAHKGELLALLQQPKGATAEAEPHHRSTLPVVPRPMEAWFQLGASAPRREQFAYDPETKTHPGWWDYLYEIHNRGLVVINGTVVKEI